MKVERCPSTLRMLANGDDGFVEPLLGGGPRTVHASGLHPKAYALVRIGTLIGLDPGPQAYKAPVEAARRAGATDAEIVGALIAALPVVGAPAVASAAPSLGLALGYDLDLDLEAT
jgi:4-carboxymuconolactone decarboxylase